MKVGEKNKRMRKERNLWIVICVWGKGKEKQRKAKLWKMESKVERKFEYINRKRKEQMIIMREREKGRRIPVGLRRFHPPSLFLF